MSPNRVVAFLTPLAFAPLAGGVSTWLANHVPGAEVSQGQLQEIFIAGALVALAPAAQWLHGWQKYETQQAEREQMVEAAAAAAAGAPVLAEPQLEDADELEDFEELDEFDDLDEFDEELEEELDELDQELLFDEEPAPAGS